MCLIAFALHASARRPLVIAANRDEFFNRPTVPLGRWQTGTGQTLISGRDLRAGGTWLGLTPGGRCAMLTNVRQAQPTLAARSRGELVLSWLENEMDADEFMAQTDSAAYGGFNLVLGDFQRDRWTWLSNRDGGAGADTECEVMGAASPRVVQGFSAVGWHWQDLAPGVYGLSNAGLDTPWPKTLALKAALTDALQTPDAATLESALWGALASRHRANAENLPDTGVALDIEQSLSSAFVEAPERGYGTRCSTLLVASAADTLPHARSWTLRFQEKTHRQWQKEKDKNEVKNSIDLPEEEDFNACELGWYSIKQ